MVEHLLDSLRRYKVICDFSEKDFDADKTVQYSKLRKEMAKKYEGFGPVETTINPRADLSIQESKEYGGKIKLENKLIDTGYNRVLQKVKILRQAFSKAIVSGTRSGSHRMVYRHFEVMKSIWGGSPNVEPVPFGI